MSRIDLPTADQTPAATLPMLAAVNAHLGVTPNLMKMMGHSPAALEGYLNFNGALAKGTLGTKTAERIALAIAEINGCSYCLSAHSYLGKNVAKLDDTEMAANRDRTSTDTKAAAAVRFAAKIALERGHVADADVQSIKAAGYSDAQVMEIVSHVALNTLTNYINSVAQTEIDFPVVNPMRKAK